jgi:hypothetical protein
MKKLITAFLIIVISQAAIAQNVSFGPIAGFGHSWVTGTDNVVFNPGVNVGATLIYSPSEHWGLGGDIRFSFLEGSKSRIETGGNENEIALRSTYLRIPLKVVRFFGDYGNRVRPKLYVGPSFGFLLGGKQKSYYNGTVTQEYKSKDILETFDFGFIAGAGVNLRISRLTWLNIDLAYQNGLLDVTKGQQYNASRNIGLNVGITFPLGTVEN